jgi:hypothetical protein
LVRALLALLPYRALRIGRPPRLCGSRQRHAASGFTWLQVLIGFDRISRLSVWGLNAMKQAGAMKDPTARFFGMDVVDDTGRH